MRCIFCDFLNGKIKEHKKGYPFIINFKTKNTVSFISLDSPVNKKAHLLVIPKKHHNNFHDIPTNTKKELIEHISQIGHYFNKKGLGYNILLNNSNSAGQTIPHTHFHVIPRAHKDGIKIEVWQRHQISPKDFIELSEKTRSEFSKI